MAYLQSYHVRDLVMHVEMEYAPSRLRCRNVAALDPALDFVALVDFDSRKIPTLVDVFESIFESPERYSTFDIDVTIVLGR